VSQITFFIIGGCFGAGVATFYFAIQQGLKYLEKISTPINLNKD
jgi:hypothetical protein